jgi:ABC transporter substrate binding protein
MTDKMRRRAFIALLGGSAAWPLAARAQQPDRMRRIGFWVGEPESNPNAQRRVGAFKQGLQDLNWREGHNIKIEYRWAILNPDRIRDDAASLVALDPDVIVTTGAPTVAALHQVTRSIPIVFTFVTDPVRDGFVESLSHPGGNITGFTIFEHTMAGKWLGLLKEAAPHITRVAVMQNPEHPGTGVGVTCTPTDGATVAMAFKYVGHACAAFGCPAASISQRTDRRRFCGYETTFLAVTT